MELSVRSHTVLRGGLIRYKMKTGVGVPGIHQIQPRRGLHLKSLLMYYLYSLCSLYRVSLIEGAAGLMKEALVPLLLLSLCREISLQRAPAAASVSDHSLVYRWVLAALRGQDTGNVAALIKIDSFSLYFLKTGMRLKNMAETLDVRTGSSNTFLKKYIWHRLTRITVRSGGTRTYLCVVFG